MKVIASRRVEEGNLCLDLFILYRPVDSVNSGN